MNIFLYILLAIVAIVLIIVALFYLAKGLISLFFGFLRLLPTLIKAAIFWGILLLLYAIFKTTYDLPTLPFAVYPVLYLAIVIYIIVRRYVKHGYVFKSYGSSGGEYKGYVLNKKSKVIHEKYSDSAETISPHHRKEISSSEADELIRNNEKYHFKN